jgi:hypothetical protein
MLTLQEKIKAGSPRARVQIGEMPKPGIPDHIEK